MKLAILYAGQGSQHPGMGKDLYENSPLAKELFEKYFPGYEEKKYKTKSGKEIDVSGEHYKNKLSAVIEKLEDKSPSKSMVGSNVIYLLDWMDNLTDLQC